MFSSCSLHCDVGWWPGKPDRGPARSWVLPWALTEADWPGPAQASLSWDWECGGCQEIEREIRGVRPPTIRPPANQLSSAETRVGRSHWLTPVLGPGYPIMYSHCHTHFGTTFKIHSALYIVWVKNRKISPFTIRKLFLRSRQLLCLRMCIMSTTYVVKWLIEFPLTDKLKAAFPFSSNPG